jgi:hypothetical protein
VAEDIRGGVVDPAFPLLRSGSARVGEPPVEPRARTSATGRWLEMECPGIRAKTSLPASCTAFSARLVSRNANEREIRDTIEFHIESLRMHNEPVPPLTSRAAMVPVSV